MSIKIADVNRVMLIHVLPNEFDIAKNWRA